MKQKFSAFMTLNFQDLGKGAIVAAVTVLLGSLYPLVSGGHIPTLAEFKTIGLGALLAGVSYLIKNLFTPTPETVVIDPTKTTIENENQQ